LAFFALLALLALAGCGPTYPKCDGDSHCAEKGEVCVENTCQQCRDDGNCKDGYQCKGGRCEVKPECAQESDCPGGKVCRSGKCALECRAKSDCGSGLKCRANRCVDEMSCTGPTDCSPGRSCEAGRCTEAMAASRSMCDLTRVNFEFNRSRLTGDARSVLEEVADCIKAKSGTITIEGHCDERGTEEYNLALGEERARAARKYLLSLGVPRSKLRIVTKGETQPLEDRSSESAWAKNRRAEFVE